MGALISIVWISISLKEMKGEVHHRRNIAPLGGLSKPRDAFGPIVLHAATRHQTLCKFAHCVALE
jgi:hypothetical protein